MTMPRVLMIGFAAVLAVALLLAGSRLVGAGDPPPLGPAIVLSPAALGSAQPPSPTDPADPTPGGSGQQTNRPDEASAVDPPSAPRAGEDDDPDDVDDDPDDEPDDDPDDEPDDDPDDDAEFDGD